MTNKTTIPPKGFVIGSNLYDKLKFIAQVLLPGIGTLYFTLGAAWNFHNTTPVIGTITAVDTFLGLMLGISSASYNASDAKFDGALNVTTNDEGGKLYSLVLHSDPEDLSGKKEITFKVDEPKPLSD